jgi:aquaporin Z
MLEYLIEFIGTFFLLFVIFFTGNPIAIGLTLAAMIAIGGKISGGHFNPAVSFMMFCNNKIDLTKLILYITVQFK